MFVWTTSLPSLPLRLVKEEKPEREQTRTAHARQESPQKAAPSRGRDNEAA